MPGENTRVSVLTESHQIIQSLRTCLAIGNTSFDMGNGKWEVGNGKRPSAFFAVVILAIDCTPGAKRSHTETMQVDRFLLSMEFVIAWLEAPNADDERTGDEHADDDEDETDSCDSDLAWYIEHADDDEDESGDSDDAEQHHGQPFDPTDYGDVGNLRECIRELKK